MSAMMVRFQNSPLRSDHGFLRKRRHDVVVDHAAPRQHV